MAKVESVRLVDDITGDEADETVAFGLDGRRFEIDLTAANAGRLREDLARFVAAARSAAGPGRSAGPSDRTGAAASGSADREHNRAVREWAREHGYSLSERGRIPAEVLAAYDRGEPAASGTAQAGPAAPAEQPAAADRSGPPEAAGAPAEPDRTAPAKAPAVHFSG
ncbi:histone-like nucleoid-structuring protein Lsr2 [Pseudonocardia sp. HH130630-07]|uniref:histone-like nucleoid-structuring protein Lsr2 n=1 Tax=Pseudonocardia sp. HH130630-07 TaxID=1690815 RepID=UPI000839C92D